MKRVKVVISTKKKKERENCFYGDCNESKVEVEEKESVRGEEGGYEVEGEEAGEQEKE